MGILSQPCRKLMESQALAPSLLGYVWQQREVDTVLSLAISQRHDLPPQLAGVLAGRVPDLAAVEQFLQPSLRAALGDPSRLQHMDLALDRTVQALRTKDPIAIWGDYDVDGATSSALLALFFRSLGHEAIVHIPDRVDEGYGPNAEGLQELYQQGCRLTFVVDSGTLAFAPLATAKAFGMDVIVLDHHQAKPELPDCYALINPNRLDDSSGYNSQAAVGIVFLFLIGLCRALKQAGWAEADLPDLLQWLDIVALGTVCDVVPLHGLNRALVSQGLRVMRQGRNVGLNALAASANLTKPPSAHSLGFVLGPRINAGGRVGKADLGVRLLTCTESSLAQQLAMELDRLNQERRSLEQQAVAQALSWVEEEVGRNPDTASQVLVVANPSWHPGIIGLVSSRLVEVYQRPAVAFSLSAHPAKGSGRSIAGFDLGGAVLAARQAGLLVDGGGHAMAAGMSLAAEDVEAELSALRGFFQNRFLQMGPNKTSINSRQFDGYLGSLAWQSPDFLSQLQRLAPFGEGNLMPKFCITDLQLIATNEANAGMIQAIFQDRNGKWIKSSLARRLARHHDHLLMLKNKPLSAIISLQLYESPRGLRAYLNVEDVVLA
jgi:single-stranded-DNA-specific exonuclease